VASELFVASDRIVSSKAEWRIHSAELAGVVSGFAIWIVKWIARFVFDDLSLQDPRARFKVAIPRQLESRLHKGVHLDRDDIPPSLVNY
jgi:hypothetical protein